MLKEENLPGTTWSWTAPSEDFKGYMVDIYETGGDGEKIYQSIAVDVSSDWTKFPRYGFLSSYGDLTKEQIARNIETLNRYRINGIQFYDWMYDHHRPLAVPRKTAGVMARSYWATLSLQERIYRCIHDRE